VNKHLSLLLVLLGFIAGCSDGGTEVKGKVSFKDGSPLSTGTVVLDDGSVSFRGGIGSDGTYTIKGVPEGQYNVAIVGAVSGDTTTGVMEYDEEGNYIEPETTESKPLIAEKFNTSAESGLTVEVPGDYDITVEAP